MHAIPLLRELTIITGIGVLVTVVLGRLRLPTVAGLLLAGALLGPYGLRLIPDAHDIEVFAEVGVVLLLFTIGLEFSLARMRHIFRQVALGGMIQVFGTIAVTYGIAALWGAGPQQAVLLGFVVALSSTAIVLRALSDRGELDAPHGRFIVGTLIFQDLCVVPMVLLVPLLSGHSAPSVMIYSIGVALGLAALVVGAGLGLARLIVPHLLGWVDASRSREVFLLSVLCICIGTAWLTSQVGLSVALGAFLGGMVVADTEFHQRALSEMIPLRDGFVSVFFVSLGMLFDWRLLLDRPVDVGLLLLAFMAGKSILVFLAALIMRFPPRAAWLAGIGLGQFGEFGFVLLRLGQTEELMTTAEVQPILAAGIISMFLTPILIRVAPHITAGELILAPLARLMRVRAIDEIDAEELPDRYVLLVGYGVAGQTVAQALTTCGTRHVVLEMNVETVRRARARGEPVYYADATSEEALRHARAQDAAAVVVVINDPSAVFRVVETVERVAPNVPVVVRTRYLSERARLLDLGAAAVIADEVEASLAAVEQVLQRIGASTEETAARVGEARTRLAEDS